MKFIFMGFNIDINKITKSPPELPIRGYICKNPYIEYSSYNSRIITSIYNMAHRRGVDNNISGIKRLRYDPVLVEIDKQSLIDYLDSIGWSIHGVGDKGIYKLMEWLKYEHK
jgi:hypothetical protein